MDFRWRNLRQSPILEGCADRGRYSGVPNVNASFYAPYEGRGEGGGVMAGGGGARRPRPAAGIALPVGHGGFSTALIPSNVPRSYARRHRAWTARATSSTSETSMQDAATSDASFDASGGGWKCRASGGRW